MADKKLVNVDDILQDLVPQPTHQDPEPTAGPHPYLSALIRGAAGLGSGVVAMEPGLGTAIGGAIGGGGEKLAEYMNDEPTNPAAIASEAILGAIPLSKIYKAIKAGNVGRQIITNAVRGAAFNQSAASLRRAARNEPMAPQKSDILGDVLGAAPAMFGMKYLKKMPTEPVAPAVDVDKPLRLVEPAGYGNKLDQPFVRTTVPKEFKTPRAMFPARLGSSMEGADIPVNAAHVGEDTSLAPGIAAGQKEASLSPIATNIPKEDLDSQGLAITSKSQIQSLREAKQQADAIAEVARKANIVEGRGDNKLRTAEQNADLQNARQIAKENERQAKIDEARIKQEEFLKKTGVRIGPQTLTSSTVSVPTPEGSQTLRQSLTIPGEKPPVEPTPPPPPPPPTNIKPVSPDGTRVPTIDPADVENATFTRSSHAYEAGAGTGKPFKVVPQSFGKWKVVFDTTPPSQTLEQKITQNLNKSNSALRVMPKQAPPVLTAGQEPSLQDIAQATPARYHNQLDLPKDATEDAENAVAQATGSTDTLQGVKDAMKELMDALHGEGSPEAQEATDTLAGKMPEQGPPAPPPPPEEPPAPAAVPRTLKPKGPAPSAAVEPNTPVGGRFIVAGKDKTGKVTLTVVNGEGDASTIYNAMKNSGDLYKRIGSAKLRKPVMSGDVEGLLSRTAKQFGVNPEDIEFKIHGQNPPEEPPAAAPVPVKPTPKGPTPSAGAVTRDPEMAKALEAEMKEWSKKELQQIIGNARYSEDMQTVARAELAQRGAKPAQALQKAVEPTVEAGNSAVAPVAPETPVGAAKAIPVAPAEAIHGPELPPRKYMGDAGQFFTLADEQAGYPKTREALAGYSDEQLAKARTQSVRDSLDRMFGHHAKRFLSLIDDEIGARAEGMANGPTPATAVAKAAEPLTPLSKPLSNKAATDLMPAFTAFSEADAKYGALKDAVKAGTATPEQLKQAGVEYGQAKAAHLAALKAAVAEGQTVPPEMLQPSTQPAKAVNGPARPVGRPKAVTPEPVAQEASAVAAKAAPEAAAIPDVRTPFNPKAKASAIAEDKYQSRLGIYRQGSNHYLGPIGSTDPSKFTQLGTTPSSRDPLTNVSRARDSIANGENDRIFKNLYDAKVKQAADEARVAELNRTAPKAETHTIDLSNLKNAKDIQATLLDKLNAYKQAVTARMDEIGETNVHGAGLNRPITIKLPGSAEYTINPSQVDNAIERFGSNEALGAFKGIVDKMPKVNPYSQISSGANWGALDKPIVAKEGLTLDALKPDITEGSSERGNLPLASKNSVVVTETTPDKLAPTYKFGKFIKGGEKDGTVYTAEDPKILDNIKTGDKKVKGTAEEIPEGKSINDAVANLTKKGFTNLKFATVDSAGEAKPATTAADQVAKLPPERQGPAISNLLSKAKALNTKKGQKGEFDPQLLAKIGLGTAGAIAGAATTPNAPWVGAMLGAGTGFYAPTLYKAVSGHINSGGLTPEGKDEATKALGAKVWDWVHTFGSVVPDVYRGSLLSKPSNLAINTLVGPYGSALMGSIEKALSGDERGWNAVKELANATNFWKEFQGSGEEAHHLVYNSNERMGGLSNIEGHPIAEKVQNAAALPGKYMTQGDLAARKILMRNGFTEAEAREMNLTSDPIFPIDKAMSNAKTTKGINEKPSWLLNMMLPFFRTNANQMEQSILRVPALGLLARKVFNLAPETGRATLVKNGMSMGVGALGYWAGQNTPPEQQKLYLKFMSDFAGVYGVTAQLGFIAGAGSQKGDPAAKQIASIASAIVNRDLPLPSDQSIRNIIDMWNAATDGKLKTDPMAHIPYGVVPPFLSSKESFSVPSLMRDPSKFLHDRLPWENPELRNTKSEYSLYAPFIKQPELQKPLPTESQVRISNFRKRMRDLNERQKEGR